MTITKHPENRNRQKCNLTDFWDYIQTLTTEIPEVYFSHETPCILLDFDEKSQILPHQTRTGPKEENMHPINRPPSTIST